jgi:sugar lactone lactonase YvrE
LKFAYVASDRHELGECPTWDERSEALLWTSITEGCIHRLYVASGRRESWSFDSPVGSFGVCASGRFVVALRDEVVLFDPATGHRDSLARIGHSDVGMRLNDGKVGPDGAFWVGSMDDRKIPIRETIGKLYRVDGAGRVDIHAEGIRISNGLAWNSAGTTMYFSDSRSLWVDAFDFDPSTGDTRNRRRFLTLTDDIGRPDGATCDTNDNYWSAGVTAAKINCFSPSGDLLESFEVPTFRPTMPCFGGVDFETLYVTSFREGLSREQVDANPNSGATISFRPGARGLPTQRFRD